MSLTPWSNVDSSAGDIGNLQFGILYAQTNGIVYFRDANGDVTSAPEVATIPEGFGYLASVTPIVSGTASAIRAFITAR